LVLAETPSGKRLRFIRLSLWRLGPFERYNIHTFDYLEAPLRKWSGPNDEVQNDQLDIAHHMFLMLLGNKLHLAPIQNPQRILDLGCGTGIWCMDMADGNLIP
jgi:predicted TPR repeat methyltransferase